MTAKAIILSLRYIFVLRKPELHRLDCVNLVIDGKLLLFIAWETKKMSFLNILKTEHCFYKLQGIHLLKLPDNMNKVYIQTHNLWRRRIIKIDLIKTRLDDDTMKLLIGDLNIIGSVMPSTILRAPFSSDKKLGLELGEKMPQVNIKVEPAMRFPKMQKAMVLSSELLAYKDEKTK